MTSGLASSAFASRGDGGISLAVTACRGVDGFLAAVAFFGLAGGFGGSAGCTTIGGSVSPAVAGGELLAGVSAPAAVAPAWASPAGELWAQQADMATAEPAAAANAARRMRNMISHSRSRVRMNAPTPSNSTESKAWRSIRT